MFSYCVFLPSPAGVTADQTFSIVIDKTKNMSVDFTLVQDVIFGLDYTASY